jgi:hypothetical protein
MPRQKKTPTVVLEDTQDKDLEETVEETSEVVTPEEEQELLVQVVPLTAQEAYNFIAAQSAGSDDNFRVGRDKQVEMFEADNSAIQRQVQQLQQSDAHRANLKLAAAANRKPRQQPQQAEVVHTAKGQVSLNQQENVDDNGESKTK